MREMKDSGVPWIGDIPTMIRLKKLKYLVSFEKGKLPEETNLEGNGSPYIGASEMNGSAPKLFTTSAIPMCREDDILILWDGANAGLVSTNHKGAVSSTVCRVRKQSGDDSRYLYYCLKNAERYYRDKVSGTTIPHMSIDYLDDTFILGFSLTEQRRIADLLDAKCSEIDSVLEMTRASIEEYKKLKQSVITEAVTKGIRGERPMKDSGVEWIGEIPAEWRVCKMKHAISVLAGYAFSSDSFTDQGVRLLRGINVTPQGLRWEETVYWNQSIDSSIEPYQLRAGDLVLGLDRPWIKEGTRVAFVNETDLPCLLLQRVCRIRPRKTSDIRFVFWVIASNLFEEALTTDTTGISIPHISTGQLEAFIFAIPSLSEQQEIAAYLDEKCAAIDSLIASKEALIAELEAYKKSLIYEYVTGKKEVPES